MGNQLNVQLPHDRELKIDLQLRLGRCNSYASGAYTFELSDCITKGTRNYHRQFNDFATPLEPSFLKCD